MHFFVLSPSSAHQLYKSGFVIPAVDFVPTTSCFHGIELLIQNLYKNEMGNKDVRGMR